jgi:putative endonuclease
LVKNTHMGKTYYVYIMTNVTNNALYSGVTSNLHKRVFEPKNGLAEYSFSKKCHLCKLVYFELGNDVMSAISREKQLKRWHRQWKVNLIRENNLEFDDLNIN